MTDDQQFPRTAALPRQSPKYWVREKDRYLRQLLIRDIEASTGRQLAVYFSVAQGGRIDWRDADDLSEVLADCGEMEVDLFLQTRGGEVDACEKLISVLRQRTGGYRVLIPTWAKSAGTIISLSGSDLVMGVNSELGPIDPQFEDIPAEFIRDDPKQSYPVRRIAEQAIQRMHQMAKQVLQSGLMAGCDPAAIAKVVERLSSTESYLSHGAVINAQEARKLGLPVIYLAANDLLWQRLWLLYCMYDYDCHERGYAKVIEGVRFSMTRSMPGQ